MFQLVPSQSVTFWSPPPPRWHMAYLQGSAASSSSTFLALPLLPSMGTEQPMTGGENTVVHPFIYLYIYMYVPSTYYTHMDASKLGSSDNPR